MASLSNGIPRQWHPSAMASLGNGIPRQWHSSAMASLGNGIPRQWHPSAMASLSNGIPRQWHPSAMASLGNGIPQQWRPSAIFLSNTDEITTNVAQSGLHYILPLDGAPGPSESRRSHVHADPQACIPAAYTLAISITSLTYTITARRFTPTSLMFSFR
ncbi:hypothetical protein BD779DRAFT_1674404 [Infundibulicybe gibba]|nr:hypothetical protein BD779DRAFT_1674404 [Infundibulicybe gibba]